MEIQHVAQFSAGVEFPRMTATKNSDRDDSVKRDGSMRVLALVTDAYGGTGGIAQYNRDFLECVAAHASVEEVVVVPRVIPREIQPLPAKVTHLRDAAGSKTRFLGTVAKLSSPKEGFGLVVCAHMNLLPAAWLAARRLNAPLLVMVYGVEAWSTGRWPQRYMLHRTDAVVAISAFTMKRLREWAVIEGDRIFLVPNAIDLDAYTPGEGSEQLRRRLGLGKGPVLMTLGRMDATERAKGFDEVLEVLPSLLEDFPTLTYCAAGDGSDRARLELKAEKLGVKDNTVFTGYVPEEQKLDLYRLTDLFVMPSRLEGFGYVFLEALATGVPVVASSIDGSREAVRGGAWGSLADPNNREELFTAIQDGLRCPKVPERSELAYFSKERFRERVWKALERIRAG
jgi:phosphatidyl-myo-inositol dimannoside synthase